MEADMRVSAAAEGTIGAVERPVVLVAGGGRRVAGLRAASTADALAVLAERVEVDGEAVAAEGERAVAGVIVGGLVGAAGLAGK